MKRWTREIVLGVVLFSSIGMGPAVSASVDLKGAKEVLQRLGRTMANPVEVSRDAEDEAAAVLVNQLREFTSLRGKMTSKEAAIRWLQLYDKFWDLPPAVTMKRAGYGMRQKKDRDSLSVELLMSAVPPPSAWPALNGLVSARQAGNRGPSERLLKLAVSYLTHDQEGLESSLAELKAAAALGKRDLGGLEMLLPNMPALSTGVTDERKEEIPDRFERSLQSLETERTAGVQTVQVPDLVSLTGEKRAEDLVLRALKIPGLALTVPSGGATLELVKRVVREKARELLVSQWQLVTSIEDVELYEALEDRFPAEVLTEEGAQVPFVEGNEWGRFSYDPSEGSRLTASINYMLGLIARKKVPAAGSVAEAMKAEDFRSTEFKAAWQSFDKIRFAAETLEFCRTALSARPELPLWRQCGLIAAAERQEDLVDLIVAAADRPELDLASRLALGERQVELLLALDRVDEAVSLLLEKLEVDASNQTPQARLAVARIKARLVPRLCRLGILLGRSELSRRAADAYPSILVELRQQVGFSPYSGMAFRHSSAGEMVDALADAGMYGAAEDIIITTIESLLGMEEIAQVPGGKETVLVGGFLADYLMRLVELYYQADRPGDVLTLVEDAPWWGAPDLAGIEGRLKEIHPIVGWALHQAGRDSEAEIVLQRYLLGHPGDDLPYQILLEIRNPDLASWLDALYARDRFEERPLIWKASLLMREGMLQEAEATVRQALKVDPTDGETKAGSRARGYAVLGEILRTGGKLDDAAFFEQVVASVRIAERGDDLTEAGLFRRSLTAYEEAAISFADAYCVQWRLAERLSAMGNLEEARKHYEIAFKRMPEQFGQVASLCFGCEGVFNHPESQSVAEKILGGLANTDPFRPQVQYLLGELREAQGRKAEAYHHYRKAAELDSEYLDAWEKAYRLKAAVFLSQREKDEIALRMLRLDPFSRHVSISAGAIWDPAGVWAVYEDAGRRNVPLPEPSLPLKASAEALEELKKRLGSEELVLSAGYWRDSEGVMIPDPGQAVAKDPFIQGILQFIVMTSTAAE